MRLSVMFPLLVAVAPAGGTDLGGMLAPVIFAPGVISDGNSLSPAFTPAGDTVYFMRLAGDGSTLMESRRVGGKWSAPRPAPFSGKWRDMDPAIAPDRAFIVVSIRYEAQAPYRLAISFHSEGGWTAPLDLGDAVNGGTHNMGAQLGCDRRTLYYYNDRPTGPAAPAKDAPDNIWAVSLAPWLRAHGKGSLRSSPRCNAA